MAATPSTMLELGTKAPEFRLPDTNGKTLSLQDTRGPHGLLVFFICNHCPYVVHIQTKLTEIAHWAIDKGVGAIAVNSNDTIRYPDDSPEKMKLESKKAGYRFPYLFDETQATAKAYQAACTPDFFLFDKNLELIYRGQFDDSRPKNGVPVTGKDLKTAIEFLLEGKQISGKQRPSLGCNIKWKPGNEPAG